MHNLSNAILIALSIALVGACVTGQAPAPASVALGDTVLPSTRQHPGVRYGAHTDKHTREIVPRIADITRAKGFVVVRENLDAGVLVVARPDGSLPMIVLVQPDSMRWDLLTESTCWRLCGMWYAVRPLSKVDDHVVEWNDAPAAVAGAATELADAIRTDAL
jgi:hypothetical protein